MPCLFPLLKSTENQEHFSEHQISKYFFCTFFTSSLKQLPLLSFLFNFCEGMIKFEFFEKKKSFIVTESNLIKFESYKKKFYKYRV
jgi:hypothetical protein